MGNPVVHFEIAHKEAPRLQSFYAEVFNWKIDTDNPVGYGMVDTGGPIGGGIGNVPSEDYPGHVTVYVQVDDLDATLKEIEGRGGKTVMSPMAVPGGPEIAQFHDPAGNLIGLVKG